MFQKKKDRSLMTRPSSVYFWDMQMRSLAIGCGILSTKKVVRSRDVVFFEDQTIEDFEKIENAEPYVDNLIDLDQITPPISEEVDGGVEQEIEELPSGNERDDESNQEDQREQQPTVLEQTANLRRSTRARKPSTMFSSGEYVLLIDEGEPNCFQDVQNNADKDKWLKAMQEEMDSLHKNHTYDLVERPKRKRVLKNKWIFKLKTSENLQPRYKARLVVKGFAQEKGVDFDEIFSPVVKMNSIRVVLGLAASMNLEIEQLDVKTAFLHGDLEEDIFMEQPEGFEIEGRKHMVCRLRKSLYGLKQASRQWYKKFDSFMIVNGFERTISDHCVFIQRSSENDFIILLLYVDDMLIVGPNSIKIQKLKNKLNESFDMKDLGPVKKILGMQILRDRKKGKLWLSQENYIEKVLERFNMDKAKSVSCPLAAHFKLSKSQSPSSEEEREEMEKVPYASAVGCLMYAMVCTRPDIGYALGVVSRFLANPGKEHWTAVKWILKYLRGTSKLCLCFGSDRHVLQGFTDADLAGDIDTMRSTSGYLFTFAGGGCILAVQITKMCGFVNY